MSALAQKGMRAVRQPSPDPCPDGYITTTEACRRAGLTYRQVDYWCRKGYLGNRLRGEGSGRLRFWNQDDVRRLQWVAKQIEEAPTVAELWDLSAIDGPS